jgi:hypothetical protein
MMASVETTVVVRGREAVVLGAISTSLDEMWVPGNTTAKANSRSSACGEG